jgi:hypothetical protein
MKTSRQEITEMIDKPEDLKKQATVERSHYYVGGACTDAIRLLYKVLGDLHGGQ